jgi:hypothetical protein
MVDRYVAPEPGVSMFHDNQSALARFLHNAEYIFDKRSPATYTWPCHPEEAGLGECVVKELSESFYRHTHFDFHSEGFHGIKKYLASGEMIVQIRSMTLWVDYDRDRRERFGRNESARDYIKKQKMACLGGLADLPYF